jgi:hypothetical protein
VGIIWHQNDNIKEYCFFIAVKRINHCNENNLSLRWKLQTIAMKIFYPLILHRKRALYAWQK